MSKNIYVTAIEGNSGKTVVVLGLMELLSRTMTRVAFFRPIVRTGKEQFDRHIELLSKRYQIEADHEEMYGVTAEEARALVLDEQWDRLHKTILSKYKALEERSDFVLCEGTDFSGIAKSFEFDLNARIAKNLDAPILMVLNASGKTIAETSDVRELARETFLRGGCSITAAIVNRAAPDLRGGMFEQLACGNGQQEPVLVLPEDENLTRLTLADVAAGLQADQIGGKPVDLMREIRDTKVAAMRLPNFLDYVSDGCLVVTPGDREDIIIASLLTILSEDHPTVAGILLTGGLKPGPAVERLLAGVRDVSIPLLSVTSDAFSTAARLSELRAQITPENDKKIATALNLFESYVDCDELTNRITVTRSRVRTPIAFEYELIQRAKASHKHIVLPEGSDERILRAVDVLRRRGAVDLTLLGEETEVKRAAAAVDVDLNGVPIINPLTSDLRRKYADTFFDLRQHKGITPEQAFDTVGDVSYFGTLMVYCGDADGMVSGAAHTTQHTIRPSFQTIKTKPGVSVVSSAFLMCLSSRVVVFADCAVVTDPNPQQLAEIAVNSAETARAFDIEPIVALLSYSTGVSGKGADVEKVREAARIAGTLQPELKLEGPMQFDAAFDPGVAAKKAPDSEVAGRATVFVFPDLNTGNNTYKAVQRTSGAVAIGPVLQGLKKPVNDLSRGCTVTDIVNTVAITAIQAQLSTEQA